MADANYTEKDLGTIRQRIKYEDQLLNDRTGIVLTVNGLVAIANVVGQSTVVSIYLPATILFINVFWLLCAIEAWRFIRHLSVILRRHEGSVPVDVKEHEVFLDGWGCFRQVRLGPTITFGLVLPVVLCLAWAWVILAKVLCS